MNAHSQALTAPTDPVPVPFVIERIYPDPDGRALALVNIRSGPIRLDGCKLVRIEGRRARLYLPSTWRRNVTWCDATARTAATLAAFAAATAESLVSEDHPAHSESFIAPTGQTVAGEVHHAGLTLDQRQVDDRRAGHQRARHHRLCPASGRRRLRRRYGHPSPSGSRPLGGDHRPACQAWPTGRARWHICSGGNVGEDTCVDEGAAVRFAASTPARPDRINPVATATASTSSGPRPVTRRRTDQEIHGRNDHVVKSHRGDRPELDALREMHGADGCGPVLDLDHVADFTAAHSGEFQPRPCPPEFGLRARLRPGQPDNYGGNDLEEALDAFEERAAICEFDGGESRGIAEAQALLETVERFGTTAAALQTARASCGS